MFGLRRMRRPVRLALCSLVLVALALAPGAVLAKTYWFESYQKAVELIDDGQTEEASVMLERLIEDRPVPEAAVRIPGNQWLDYLPYYQRARVEMKRGEYMRAAHNLDVAEAFGAVKQNKRVMADVRVLRMELDLRLAEIRNATAETASRSVTPGQ